MCCEGKVLSCRRIIVNLDVTTLTALCKWSLAKYCGVQPDQTRGLFSSVQHLEKVCEHSRTRCLIRATFPPLLGDHRREPIGITRRGLSQSRFRPGWSAIADDGLWAPHSVGRGRRGPALRRKRSARYDEGRRRIMYCFFHLYRLIRARNHILSHVVVYKIVYFTAKSIQNCDPAIHHPRASTL